MKEPDFAANEQRLLREAIIELHNFAGEHPDELFNYFAFDCNPDYGEILLCLDTLENSITKAKEHEKYVSANRKDLAYDGLEL
jgi:hypothetical protein